MGGELKLPGVMRQFMMFMCFNRKRLMVSFDCLWVVVVSVSDRQLPVTHLETPSVSLQSISGVGHSGQKHSLLLSCLDK